MCDHSDNKDKEDTIFHHALLVTLSSSLLCPGGGSWNLASPRLIVLFTACSFFVCLFFKTGFLCVALELILELALVDQAGLELTEILPLPPECWD